VLRQTNEKNKNRFEETHVKFVFCSIFIFHEKTTMALYFGRIRTRLGVVHFRVFWLFLWLLTTEFAACSKSPSRDNHHKMPYSRTQQSVWWGWEL